MRINLLSKVVIVIVVVVVVVVVERGWWWSRWTYSTICSYESYYSGPEEKRLGSLLLNVLREPGIS